jgi:peptidoglycan hydrolase-like protein with peptidoglycan-binding domain
MSQQNRSRMLSEEPTLRQGDAGEGVVELQHLLQENGSTLELDGQFDPSTLAAVISFQQKKGLKVSGTVDHQVWGALRAGAAHSHEHEA